MECYPRIPYDAFSKQEGHNGHVERHEKSKRQVPFRQSPFLKNRNSHASASRFDLKHNGNQCGCSSRTSLEGMPTIFLEPIENNEGSCPLVGVSTGARITKTSRQGISFFLCAPYEHQPTKKIILRCEKTDECDWW